MSRFDTFVCAWQWWTISKNKNNNKEPKPNDAKVY